MNLRLLLQSAVFVVEGLLLVLAVLCRAPFRNCPAPLRDCRCGALPDCGDLRGGQGSHGVFGSGAAGWQT